MYYQKGYLAMFAAITDLTQLLEKIGQQSEPPAGAEWVNLPQCLCTIQAKGEEACIGDTL